MFVLDQQIFIQALLIAIWAGIAGIDLFNGLFHIHRPIVTGVVLGLILGDLTTGVIAGAAIELVWAGMVPLAGAQPPNVVIGGIIGVAFAILSGEDPQVAIGIAVPFAVAVQACITLMFTVFSPVMHKADQYAANADTKGIERINYMGLGVLFTFYFVIAFLPIYFGAESAKAVVETLPAWLIDGLGVAGGMMAAIGFAMLLKIMLKKQYIAFFIVGFILVTYLQMPIIAVALIALAIALYDFYKTSGGDGAAVRGARGRGI